MTGDRWQQACVPASCFLLLIIAEGAGASSLWLCGGGWCAQRCLRLVLHTDALANAFQQVAWTTSPVYSLYRTEHALCADTRWNGTGRKTRAFWSTSGLSFCGSRRCRKPHATARAASYTAKVTALSNQCARPSTAVCNDASFGGATGACVAPGRLTNTFSRGVYSTPCMRPASLYHVQSHRNRNELAGQRFLLPRGS